MAVVATIRLPDSRAGAAASGSAIQQIADGYRYVRRTPVLFWLMFPVQLSVVFWGMVFPLVPAFAVEVLDTSEVQFGWMWGALAIGEASSAILLASLGGFRRSGAALVAAASIFSACLVSFGLTQTYMLALVFLVGMGFAFPLWIAAQMTLLQSFTVPEYRGRVMAVYGIGAQSISVSWLIGGWLLDVIGIFPTVLVAVGGGWAVLMTAMIASKELRSS